MACTGAERIDLYRKRREAAYWAMLAATIARLQEARPEAQP
jgi:hypothetical protein